MIYIFLVNMQICSNRGGKAPYSNQRGGQIMLNTSFITCPPPHPVAKSYLHPWYVHII